MKQSSATSAAIGTTKPFGDAGEPRALHRRNSHFFTAFITILFITTSLPAFAADFELEKQKLKFSFEYESFVDAFRNEVITPGLKANYRLKGKALFAKSALWTFDYQTGLKRNLETSFQSGELAKYLWSNRFNTSVTVPFGKFYAGSNFYLHHKYVSESPNQFVDIFGGLGFRDLQGSIYLGVFPYPNWEVIATATATDVDFKHFAESDSRSQGASVRISRRLDHIKINLDYRKKSIDYKRPVFLTSEPFTFVLGSDGEILRQEDDFQEIGGLVELLQPFYISGGYFYQINDSNNPGFTYRNHRITLIVGTELGNDFHLQAYGIAQRQNFEESGRLSVPLFLDDSDYDTMGISLVRTIRSSAEIEFGAQRLNHNSSFRELDASKFIVFAALNYRF